ncbi:MAG: sigma-70 family RNA polymerase sigma factor [Bacteroidota bacterium]|nr:sigma-70 family RNA polymerase sigma factor [Bacteroidota bacterium]
MEPEPLAGKNELKPAPHTWVEQYGDALYRYAVTRIGDTVACEDLVQETFLSALKGYKDFKGAASEKTWLFAILKNKIIDYYRKQAASRIEQGIPESSDEEWFDENGNWRPNMRPVDWQSGDSMVERKEFNRIIQLCKEKLKGVHQQVFTLKYLEDTEGDEICKVLGLVPSNYWVMLHRIRLQMRACVEKNWLKEKY